MRVQLGLTKEELAKMCGITELNVTKIENGVYNYPIDLIGKIADALNAEITLKRKPIEYPKTVGGWRKKLNEMKLKNTEIMVVRVKPLNYFPPLKENAFRVDDLTAHPYDEMKISRVEIDTEKGSATLFV